LARPLRAGREARLGCANVVPPAERVAVLAEACVMHVAPGARLHRLLAAVDGAFTTAASSPTFRLDLIDWRCVVGQGHSPPPPSAAGPRRSRWSWRTPWRPRNRPAPSP